MSEANKQRNQVLVVVSAMESIEIVGGMGVNTREAL